MKQPRRQFIEEMLKQLTILGQAPETAHPLFEVEIVDRVSSTCDVALQISKDRHLVLRVIDKNSLSLLKTVHDISQRALDLNREFIDLNERARTDQLTGLLRKDVWDELTQTDYTKGFVVVIDLDGFKRINDTLGHVSGDRILARFGATLKAHFRESDALIRWGGDEFLLILEGISHSVLTKKIESIMHQSRQWIEFSVGIQSFQSPLELHEVLLKADQDLYRHKKQS